MGDLFNCEMPGLVVKGEGAGAYVVVEAILVEEDMVFLAAVLVRC